MRVVRRVLCATSLALRMAQPQRSSNAGDGRTGIRMDRFGNSRCRMVCEHIYPHLHITGGRHNCSHNHIVHRRVYLLPQQLPNPLHLAQALH